MNNGGFFFEERFGGAEAFGIENITHLLFRLAPPVMLAQLIQALYNIVDSYFVGSFSSSGLTALSVVYPMQWLATALAVGIGTGVDTCMSMLNAMGEKEKSNKVAGCGNVSEVVAWFVYSLFILVFLPVYVRFSANSPDVVEDSLTYGYIVCIGSIFLFLESDWAKIHQAEGNMKTPMIAECCGALTNIVMDPVLIFGLGPIPRMGVAGAAYATVLGQAVAAAIAGRRAFRRIPPKDEIKGFCLRSLKLGYPTILSQMTMSVYIVVLNLILARFSDSAVTVLGLYYKYQSFFFIPLLGLMTCMVPILSYNYTAHSFVRCRKLVKVTIVFSASLMLVGMFCFCIIPEPLLRVFSREESVIATGVPAFRAIGLSFVSAVFSFLFPVFFQAIGESRRSTFLGLCRQIFCLIPSFYLLSFIGQDATWWAFLFSETVTGVVGIVLYVKELGKWKRIEASS